MKEIRPIIRKWFDRLINKNVMGKKPKIIRDRLKDKIINDIKRLFDYEKEERKKKKQNEKIIKDNIIRDIRILFEQGKEEDYYEPKRVSNFWNNNYIEYKSNGDKNRNLSLDEYLNKIESYLRNTIINLQNSDTWKMKLTIAIDFISSKDSEEEHVMHSCSKNIKFTTYIYVNDVIEKLFKSLRSKYQNGLETSMKVSDFVFNSVQLMYYKCHKVNFKFAVSILILQTG